VRPLTADDRGGKKIQDSSFPMFSSKRGGKGRTGERRLFRLADGATQRREKEKKTQKRQPPSFAGACAICHAAGSREEGRGKEEETKTDQTSCTLSPK